MNTANILHIPLSLCRHHIYNLEFSEKQYMLFNNAALMVCDNDASKCSCSSSCPRHGKCCECVTFHRDVKKNLPSCLRGLQSNSPITIC